MRCFHCEITNENKKIELYVSYTILRNQLKTNAVIVSVAAEVATFYLYWTSPWLRTLITTKALFIG